MALQTVSWAGNCILKELSSASPHWPHLCKPMDCSRPGSSLHGILQARILEWLALLGLSPVEICPCVHQGHVHVHHCGWKTATMVINGHTGR